MMRLRGSSRRKEASIQRLPLIALVDVVLFILFYFIIAGTLTPPEGELPSSLRVERSAQGKAGSLSPQVLIVEPASPGPPFRMGSRAFSDARDLLPVLGALPKEPGVVVKARGGASVAHAAAALQACRDAGFSRLSYVPAE